MKKKIILLFGIASLVFLTGCKNENSGKSDPLSASTQNAAAQPATPEQPVEATPTPPVNNAPQEENPATINPNLKDKGIGPIKSVELGATIDQSLAKNGEEIYNKLCTSCHKPTKKFIGPAPKGVLDRRSPEWVMNMILNPEEMIKKDPIAIELLKEHNGSPMSNQNVTEQEARAILEYFRTL